jgi:uncharacterized protein YdaU (DUF1376 family)
MKHYPHHIGDFDRATRHLTRIERSVYRDMLDLYYDTEQRLTLDMAALCRRIIARCNEESTAVEQVLNEFFTKTETGWYHDRCESELEAYRANNSQRAQAGKASAESKRLKRQQALNGTATPVERPLNSVETNGNGASTNQSTNQPINQEPVKGESRKRSTRVERPDGVDEQVWSDWLQLRKAKKAPVTETVVKSANAEAAKAGIPLSAFLQIWCARGSQGLEASWLTSAEKRSQPAESFYERDQRLKAEEMAKWAPGIAKKPLNFANPFEYIDMEPSNVIAIESH